ncbi:hypothetical protein V8G54_022749 [Vigna mungo]|uniref:Uncharacterized protein n=1 Tax=Vigna mungo TaxID=3915 RepID=A0AAQ3N2G5_VIGMU
MIKFDFCSSPEEAFLKARKHAPQDKAIARELRLLAEHDKAVYQKQKEIYKGTFGPRVRFAPTYIHLNGLISSRCGTSNTPPHAEVYTSRAGPIAGGTTCPMTTEIARIGFNHGSDTMLEVDFKPNSTPQNRLEG